MDNNLKVLILAGGYDQIALIQEFKNRGYYTILIDYYPNPPAKNYADFHYQASTLDIDAVKRIAIEEDVDLITTACTDQALLTVSKVSEEIKLPCYISHDKALKVTNKMYMKKIMKDTGIPTANHIEVSNASEVSFSNFKFPLVIKPADCNSSKGVFKVHSHEEALKVIEYALSISRSHTAIVEDFIEGIEVSVDAFISRGKADILLITESEKIKNTNGFTIIKSKYPVRISSAITNQIESIVQSICNSFNLIEGPLLVQMLIYKDKIYVIEFSARMGGGSKYKLIEVLTGFNIMKAYVDLVTGTEPTIEHAMKYNFAHLNYCYVSEGVFNKIVGIDELMNRDIISEFFKYKMEGTFIEKAETSSDRVAGYLITANTMEELISKEKIANSNLKILSDDDVDIMRHDLI
jgi:phosphoribosylamine-glycine ligase